MGSLNDSKNVFVAMYETPNTIDVGSKPSHDKYKGTIVLGIDVMNSRENGGSFGAVHIIRASALRVKQKSQKSVAIVLVHV